MKAKIYTDNGRLLEEIECETFSHFDGLIELMGESKKDEFPDILCRTNMTVIIERDSEEPKYANISDTINVCVYDCRGRIMKEWEDCNSLSFNGEIYSFWTGEKLISVFGKIYIQPVKKELR